jgi:diacylglycerol diphosphate phosphatase / phosphatidate phosphatase
MILGPTNHSFANTVAFAGLGYLAWWFAGKIHLFDGQGHTIKSWICLIPLIGAGLIAISRNMDVCVKS